MKRQTTLAIMGLSIALGVGWFAGRTLPGARETNQPPVVQLDARAMQLLFRNDSGAAASINEPVGKLRINDHVEKPEPQTPDIAYFPQALAAPSLDEEVQAEQQRVWLESLAHLSPEAAHEIQSLKTRLGSVAAASLGLDHLKPSGTEPAQLQLPDDGSIKAVTPVSGTSNTLPGSVQPASGKQKPASSVAALPVVREDESSPPFDLWREVHDRNEKFAKSPGFKRTVLLPVVTSDGTNWEPRLDLTPGTFQMTGNAFDIAIEGDGWFVVRLDEQAQCLTRCGLLTLDDQSRLCLKTGRGKHVLVPEIVLPPMSQQLQIEADGVCRVLVGGEAEPKTVGSLQLGSCLNPSQLRCTDDGLFVVTAESGALWSAAPGTRGLGKLRQKSLEQAKADSVEMR